MKAYNNRNLTFFVAWLLCMGFVLAFNFSWIGLGALVILGVVMLVTNVFGEKAKSYIIPLRLRNYAVSSVAFFLAAYVAQNLGSFISADTADYYDFVIGLIMEHIALSLFENKIVVIILFVISIVLVFIRGRFTKLDLLYTVLKYQFRVLLFSLLFYFATGNIHVIIGYVAVALAFIFCDVLRSAYAKVSDNVGMRWLGLFSIILFVLKLINNDIYNDLATFHSHKLAGAFGTWYTALFLMVVTVGALVVTHVFQDNYKAESTFEEMTYFALASFVLVAFFAGCFYVGYSWLVMALFFVFACIYIAYNGPRPGKFEEFKKEFSKFKLLPLVAAAVSFCILEAHFGKFFVAFAFVISIVLGIMLGKKILGIENSGRRDAWMYTLILTLLYANTAVRMWTSHCSAYLIIIMGVVCAVLCAIIWVANYNPEVYLENAFLTVFQLAVPVLYLVLCLVVFAHGGSTVKIDVDGVEKITVEAEAHGKENEIKSLSYMWITDSDSLDESLNVPVAEKAEEEEAAEDAEEAEAEEESEDASDKKKDKKDKYIEIESGDEIKIRTGLLKIVAEDENGIKTTVKRWCYVPDESRTPYELPELPEEE